MDDALVTAVWRSQVFFSDYCAFVRDWAMRPHQRLWFSALQALGDGVLRHPEQDSCEKCRKIERVWIDEFDLPYSEGYRAECGICKTTNKLMILAFFGSGKSDTLIEWNEWILGRKILEGDDPQLGWVSYGDNVAAGRSRAVRETIEQNKKFKLVFPGVVPNKKEKWSDDEWVIQRKNKGKKDPTFRSAGIGGSIFSYRFTSGLTLDDPQDPKEADSETYLDHTWWVWRMAIKSRAAQGVTPMVMISNRLAEGDIAGRLMSIEGDWLVIRTPALDDFDQSVFPVEVLENGAPVGLSTEDLLKMRDEDSRSFSCGYMVLPPSATGGYFQLFVTKATPNRFAIERVVQFWDTATTQKSMSSHTAMVEVWKLKNGQAFVAQAINVKKSPGEIMDMISLEYNRALDEELPNVRVLIENAQAGPAFADSVFRLSGVVAKLHNIPGAGKNIGRRGPQDLPARASGVVKFVDTGIVYFPESHPAWKDNFLNQLRAFPSRPDDMVAAFVGAMENLYPQRHIGAPYARQIVRTR